jgi:hypothetical protein
MAERGPVLIPSIEEVEAMDREAEARREKQAEFDAGFAEYERRLEDEGLEELEAEDGWLR